MPMQRYRYLPQPPKTMVTIEHPRPLGLDLSLEFCTIFVDRKGNSLFAEVDDQRQAMKHLLAAQKKSYLDMKKTFSDSQFEIRRLKRENVAMHTELQACSTIFCSADKTYQSEYSFYGVLHYFEFITYIPYAFYVSQIS